MGLPNCFCDFNAWLGYGKVDFIQVPIIQQALPNMYNIIPVIFCVGLLITGIILILSLDSVAYGYSLIGITLVGVVNYIVITRIKARREAERRAALHAEPIV